MALFPKLAAGALLIGALAACVPPVGRGPETPIGKGTGPELIVRFSKTGQEARTMLEYLAASCWLDGVVGGAQLIVDRQSGGVVIVDDTKDLVAAEFLRPKDGRSRIRLTGPAIRNPATADRLVATLDRAVKTGETTCPRLAG